VQLRQVSTSALLLLSIWFTDLFLGLLKKRKKAKLADPKEGGEKKAVTAATVPSVPVEELKETPHVSAAA